MATPVSTVSTKLIGIPMGSSHFHAPSCQPTERTTEARATMITVVGNHPVIRSRVMARVLIMARFSCFVRLRYPLLPVRVGTDQRGEPMRRI